ncbi:MAG: energy transducer TonB [Vicinamibacterales bacterium]
MKLATILAAAVTTCIVSVSVLAQEIYGPGNGVAPPTLVKTVQPDYTPEAMAKRIQGVVTLTTVVQADGKVGAVTVKESLDSTHGLDQQAVIAMKQWEFNPGVKDGQPVAVRITVEMSFSLKDSGPVKPTVDPADVRGAAQQVASYYFFSTRSGGSLQIPKYVVEAGKGGFALQLTARVPFSNGMLFRAGVGPREYEVVKTRRLATLVKDMNETGARGFRYIPDSAKAFSGQEWVAVMEKQPDSTRFGYSAVQGDAEGKSLVAARQRGLALVANLGGQPILVFEEVLGSTPTPAAVRDYRIVSTTKSSTLEKEIADAAAEGFHTIAAGAMNVIMEREPGSASRVEYKLVATTKVATSERELNDFGAQGFHLVAAPMSNTNEGVFILERVPGTTAKFEHRIAQLVPATINNIMRGAEGAGFQIVVLFSDLAIFERVVSR